MEENYFFCQTLLVARRHAANDETRDAVKELYDRFCTEAQNDAPIETAE